MIAVLVGLFSFVAVVAGALCLYEFTLYTAAQKAQVPRLSKAYLAVVGLLIAVGVAGVAAVIVGADVRIGHLGVLAILAAFPAILQNRMHRKMGVEQGPLVGHVVENWF